MSELATLSELEKACDLIDAQLAAGMDEADVKETLSRSYEARIAAYPSLRSEQKAALTVAINEGPWSSEQKRMLATAVLASGTTKKQAARNATRQSQQAHRIENLIPMTTMAKIKDVEKYSETSRKSILAAAVKSIGIVNPDETILLRLVSIIAASNPASNMDQRTVWDQMSTIQKFVKAGGATKLEYIVIYPPTAILLPAAIQTSCYGNETLPPELDWPELDSILGNFKQRGNRSVEKKVARPKVKPFARPKCLSKNHLLHQLIVYLTNFHRWMYGGFKLQKTAPSLAIISLLQRSRQILSLVLT